MDIHSALWLLDMHANILLYIDHIYREKIFICYFSASKASQSFVVAQSSWLHCFGSVNFSFYINLNIYLYSWHWLMQVPLFFSSSICVKVVQFGFQFESLLPDCIRLWFFQSEKCLQHQFSICTYGCLPYNMRDPRKHTTCLACAHIVFYLGRIGVLNYIYLLFYMYASMHWIEQLQTQSRFWQNSVCQHVPSEWEYRPGTK